MSERLFGALIGWKRQPLENGMAITIQLGRSAAAIEDGDLDQVLFTMNDRQLRSLARDLARTAEERGIELRPQKRSLFGWR